ncbi:MAG: M56 family metallopeptidase [Solirubrobacteraceae bacterium]
MASARRVLSVQLAVALLGAAVTVAALLVAVSRVDFRVPSLGELAAACQRYALPDLRPASVLVLVLGSVALATVALSARAVVRQLRAGWRFERRLRVLGPLPGVARAHVVDQEQPHAFCIGLLRPRIYVSRAALELLGDDERAAVLAHESHHARRRDPLRLLVARALADGLFFLPAVRRLPERYAALAELAADQAATAEPGGRRALASALLAFDEHPSPAAVGIAPERVEHLLGQRPRWELPTLLMLGSLATIAALAAITLRLADATAHATVGLPVLAAQACALAMALAPIAIGAVALLGGHRLRRCRPAG